MDRIILIAQQLAKEGKIPSTASIKSRLPKNTPLPTIILGLKMWRENPNKEINAPTEPALTNTANHQMSGSIDEIIESKIALAITPLKEEISTLKIDIKKLEMIISEQQKIIEE